MSRRTRSGQGNRPAPPDQPATREMAEELFQPLRRKSGYPYVQIENTVRQIMAEHVGPMRTEFGL